MGEIIEVDPARLRAMARRAAAAGSAIAGLSWPRPDPDQLRGSALSGITAPDLMAQRVAHVAADLRGWAETARRSADTFDHADTSAADRLGLP
ncbi:MAG: hypothetical protein JST91_15155 [Actinobacteria bacterium]|nr:hypothetical protein [Actinomycetota bacterium]